MLSHQCSVADISYFPESGSMAKESNREHKGMRGLQWAGGNRYRRGKEPRKREIGV